MINGNKVAVFTDIHFGVHANNRQFLEVCCDTMGWITSYCKENSINDVLFCGDFFDSRSSIDVNTMSKATESLYKMADEGINVTMIVGNHDIYLRNSTGIHSLLAYDGHDSIDIVSESRNVEICGKKISLLPWMAGTVGSTDDVPRGTKYVFCHHDFPASYFMKGNKRNSSDSFVSKTPYEDMFAMRNDIVESVVSEHGVIFSGHIHQSSDIPLPNGARIIIGGSPYETSWGFRESKCGMYVFDFENDDVSFVENPFNKKHIELRTSDKDSMSDVELDDKIVRLVVDTQEQFDTISKIQSLIRSKNPFIVDSTKYEFETAEFVGKRDEGENPLNSISDKPSSKLDYIMHAIDTSDFSQFSYLADGKSTAVSKERIKSLASELFDKVAH